MRTATATIVCCVLSATGIATAQGPRGPVVKQAPGFVWPAEAFDAARVVVKFVEGHAVRLRGGRFECATLALAAANEIAGRATRIERVFSRSEADLDAERKALLATKPAGLDDPADLNNYYRLTFADAAAGSALRRELDALACVEVAFPEHRTDVKADPGDVPPATPAFMGSQGYRNPAPLGIDHRASRVIPGGRGESLQVTDVETGWYPGHEDIPKLVAANVIGPISTMTDHGLATVGELAAEWDATGTTGIVDLVAVKVHSHQSANWASSVNTAAANTPVGGVVMLEVQLPGLNGQVCPMETRQDVFDATRNAVLAGKHVIAAAGNGTQNLDAAVHQNQFNRAVRDSGSIIVGATDGSNLVRAGFSNYGSIVDANGWGYNVTTTGYGDLFNPVGTNHLQSYTATFSGTSSATPIVTGAAMALMGAVKEQKGLAITSSELRALLRAHGTDVPGGSIGKRPDLKQLLAAKGLPDGLDITTEGTPGGTLVLDVSAAPGASWLLAAAPAPGLIDFGPGGRFLLDVGSTVTVTGGTMGPTGKVTLSFPVPNNPALTKGSVYLQQASLAGAVLRFSSSVRNYFP
jgi:hypothetical protein